MRKFVAAGIFASVSALLFPPQAAAQQAGLNDYGATTLGGSAYLTWAFPAARGNAIRYACIVRDAIGGMANNAYHAPSNSLNFY